MKKVKYAILAAALALTAAGCMKTEQNYTPNPQYPGDNLYFPADAPTKVELDKDQPLQFDINVYRGGDTTDPLDATLAITGEAIDENFVTIESAVAHFAAGESTAKITATVDGDKLGLNKTTTFTVAIADESQTSPVGGTSLTYSVIIPLPWLVFDSGIIYEAALWEEEEVKTLYYQQLADTLRYCKIPACFGYSVMQAGKPYDVQDYCFYWNTKTDAIYIPKQYTGETNSNGEIWFMDESEYYNWKGYGFEAGTADWFAFLDAFRAAYPTDYYPYYDGNGVFYLADVYTAGEPGTPDFLGAYTMQEGYDSFFGDSFEHFDYTTTVEYKGVYVTAKGDASPIIKFTGAADVKGVKYVLTDDATADLATVIASIVDGTAEGIVDVELTGGEATDMPEIDPGVWFVIAVPYGADDALHADNAVQIKINFKGINPAPAGSLVTGFYSYECDNEYEGVLVLSALDATHYTVSGIGISDGTEWNAVYDKAKGILTCDGTVYGREGEGNLFSTFLGAIDPEETMLYTVESYASQNSDGTDPIVFDVAPSTGELVAVYSTVYVSLYDAATYEYIGEDYTCIADGASLEFLGAPPTTSVTLARSTSKQSAKPVLLKAPSSNVRTHKHSVKNATMTPKFGYWNGLSKAKPGLKDCRALIK